MKRSLIIAVLAAGLSGAAFGADAQKLDLSVPATGAAAAPAAAEAPKYTELQALEMLGWVVGKQSLAFGEVSYTPEQTAAIVKGFTSASLGKGEPYNAKEIEPVIAEFMQAKGQEYMEKQKVEMDKMAKENEAKAAAFVATLKGKPGVVALPSGLLYEVVVPGTGDSPKATDSVKVHYTGTLIDGTKFDSSFDRDGPAEFTLDQVIAGWTEGIQKMKKGGKIKLYVPANLAYGNEGRPSIPPGSLLIFDVELLDIKAADAKPAAK